MDSVKTVVIGVTGCVAAYKTCEVIRQLQKHSLRVKVVMTQHATEFISPYQFRSLTREPVAVGLFDDAPGDPIHHISLAKEADAMLIAPCTANVIAKLACGIADDLLTTTALALQAPLLVAPAMNPAMYTSQATQHNIAVLKQRGVTIISPDSGYVACGDEGVGRLAPIDALVDEVLATLFPNRDLSGLSVLITAGPTREFIDPVRFISNPSSGKTGFMLAQAAQRRGASVTLITGPVDLSDIDNVNTVHVTTAQEMFIESSRFFDQADIAIFSAAVCDMRPATVFNTKLKKGKDDALLSELKLEPNPDILATLAQSKQAHQVVVGYAAETENVLDNATKKLNTKHADIIVANNVGSEMGFASDDNEISLVTHEGVVALPPASKRVLADAILDTALAALQQKR